jgi:hypothetical protein
MKLLKIKDLQNIQNGNEDYKKRIENEKKAINYRK